MSRKPQQLKDVCHINPRINRNRLGLQDNTEVSFVPMEAVNEMYGVIDSKSDRQYRKVKQGYTAFLNSDVLFAKITPCMENGKVALATNLTNGVGFGSTEFHVLRAHDEILPMYLYHFVKRESFRRLAKQQMTGAVGQQRVPKRFLENISISVPSLKDQKRIVEILDRAENIKRLRLQAITTTQRIVVALFHEMFGNPVKNEKGWNTTTIADITSNIEKSHPKEVFNNTFPYIDISGIDNAVGKINEVKNVAVDEAPSRARQIVATNDVLVSTVRPYLRAFALVNNSNNGAICSTGFSVLRCNGTIHPIFLFTYVRLNTFVDAMMAKARGASYPAISDADVRNHTLILPPIEKQLEFARRVEILYRVDRRQSQSAIKIEQLSSALRTHLFAT